MKNYTILIVSNRRPHEPYFCYDEFYKSLPNEPIVNVGSAEFEYLSDRPRILYKALKAGVVKTPYVIFCDSWDLFFVDSPEDVLGKHNMMFRSDLTFSMEKNCFPDSYKRLFDNISPETTSYKYLNCGVIVGRTEALLYLLEDMDAPNLPRDYYDKELGRMHHYNEQGWYMEAVFRSSLRVGFDWYQDVCNCLQNVKIGDLDFSEKKIRNIECNTYPSIMHFNGSSKTDGLREPILKHYGYL